MLRAFVQGLLGQLRRMATERRYQVMLFLLLLMSVLSMDIYRRLVVQQMPVAVVDRDNSHISRTLRTFMGATREVRVVGEPLQSPEQAQQMLIEGRIVAVVLIPSDFSEKIKKGRKGDVIIGVDGSNILTGKNVYKALAQAAGTVGAGVQLTQVQKLGERDDKVMARVVPIAIEENLSFNPATNYAVYLAPGVLFYLLHIFVVIVAASMFLPSGPKGPWALTGASVAIVSVGMVLGLLFFYGLLPREQLHPVTSLTTTAACLAAFLAVDMLMAWGLARIVLNQLQALQLTVIYTMLSLMISGFTWPLDMFPPALRVLAEGNPFTAFARALRMIYSYPFGLPDFAQVFRWLGQLALLYTAMGLVGAAVRSARAAWLRRASC